MADLLLHLPGDEADTDPAAGKRLKGVFSTMVQGVIGHGTTKKRTSQHLFMYVEELADGRFSLQPLNQNYVPSGAIQFVSREELLTQYVPEPAMYMERVMPAIRNLSRAIERGEDHYRKGESFSAEFEFKKALRVDEENIRATFGLGLTFLERGDREKGALVFKRLASLKSPFEERHKHLFNEFGIKLRKNKLYRQALKHYSRAYKLCVTDEHLLYNIARTMYELGNLRGCEKFLKKSLRLRREFRQAKDLLDLIERKRYGQRRNLKDDTPLLYED